MIHAPPLEGVAWINSQPLTWSDLRGHVVVLDFWTHCCINCLHVLPDLASLERRFANEPFVVIGVHSAKFDAEREVESVRAAVERLGVTHPVVVDSKREIWSQYGVRAWPTVLVIDAEGHVVGGGSGEPDPEKVAELVTQLLASSSVRAERARSTRFARSGRVEAPALRLGPSGLAQGERLGVSHLRFPGKVAVDGARVAIADTGNDRVVVGERVISGLKAPQGICFAGDSLYIADTGNHQVKRANLVTGEVATILGSGKRGAGPARDTDDPLAVDLRSPWDVCFVDGLLFIAMAGAHQIWALETDGAQFGPWAGSGHEARIDADRTKACFAQPSGLASDGTTLWVADAESSSVREIDLDRDRVGTVVGNGGLFDWADTLHPDEPCLQHAMGVAHVDGALLIADTFNGKVKRLDLKTREMTLIASTLHEPAGICPGWVADTNAHRIVKL